MRVSIPSLVASTLLLWAPQIGSQTTVSGPGQWEPDIQNFEAADRAEPPPARSVVFVGSSSIRAWETLKDDFPGGPVINRGFGGSELNDVVHFADRIVVPYNPRLVVLYAGDNDLAAGKSPTQVFNDFLSFVRIIHQRLPSTRVAFVAIKPSISRWNIVDKVREANRLIRERVRTDHMLAYVDVFTPMLNKSGQPRQELFLEDGLHMNSQGYAIWRDLLVPLVAAARDQPSVAARIQPTSATRAPSTAMRPQPGAAVERPATIETGFLDRTVTVDGRPYRYQIFVPPTYVPARRWPVILFLHGSGERGSDGYIQTQIGLAPAIRQNAARIPAIVIFPQATADSSWTGTLARVAIAELDQTMREYQADPARVYLTGLSMGGNGAWYIAYRNPKRFAALVPICSWVSPSFWKSDPVVPADSGEVFSALARQLRQVPTWIFHGEIDPAVPVDESRKAFAALQAAGAGVQYTEIPGTGHNSWDPAYGSPKLWAWVLAQRR
jgi:acetyl esterase/lipase